MSDTELAQKLEGAHIEDEEVFDLSAMKKKKKKSKKLALDDLEDNAEQPATKEPVEAPAPPPPAAAAEDDGDDVENTFANLKKKKKKSKTVSFDDEEGADTKESDAFDISLMKKKKKSKKSLAAFEAELGDEEADDKSNVVAATKKGSAAGEPWLGTDRDYTYPELLGRFFKVLREHNPELGGEKRKYVMVPPQVAREGVKRTLFANVEDVANRMHRPTDHLIRFIYAELGTSGSVDGSQRLLIKGRYQQKQIEKVLRSYIIEYVACRMCKSGDTSMSKEGSLHFIKCETCGSTRTAAAIKSGFQVATKGARKAAREAAKT